VPKSLANTVSRLSASLVLFCVSFAALAELQDIRTLPLLQNGAENRWRLPAGTYQGQFVIDQPIHLHCDQGAGLDAQGQGHALVIRAPGVSLEGCAIRNWGHNLTTMDSGIFIEPSGEGTELKNNHLQGSGFGIWVDAAEAVSILENQIEGDQSLRSQDRGNGIHLYAVKNARVIGNQIRHTRDGIYIDTSNGNHLENNLMEDLRYGIHYMFSHDNQVIGNTTRRTRTGYALMQSRMLTVIGNKSEDDQNYGILMNYITYSTVQNNVVSRVTQGSTDDSMIIGGEGKALFIYNSLFNRIEGNHFQHSDIGIHLTAGSENNPITGNAFVGNKHQVKYVATRLQEWSADGRGNYWSEYLGWDRNNDGVGDIPYEPNDNVDRLLWMYPQTRLLMHSPGIELLRWVQQAFPVIKSPGVKDSFPLMQIPTPSLTDREQKP
jgi:nitrous oxidase accessory protein